MLLCLLPPLLLLLGLSLLRALLLIVLPRHLFARLVAVVPGAQFMLLLFGARVALA